MSRELINLSQSQERVVLVGVELPGRKRRSRLLAELAQLADTAGSEVVGEKPIDENNHACDAMRYLVASLDRRQIAKRKAG